MCTYLTENVEIDGSGKFADGWSAVGAASVYFDHPVHAMAEHTLNLDFFATSSPAPHATGGGTAPIRRIALELTASSARELAAAIERALASAPPELTR